MNVSAPFIARPIGTTLITIGVALAGVLGFVRLPIAPLPQVDIPTISVSASLPGASPDTMAATVAAPLERVLGNIAGVTEITSRSSLGSTGITLQFELDRDIDGAARDVQSAINAARTLLPSGMPSNPTYRKVNPAAAPIMIISLTSDTLTRGQMYDAASTVLAQRLSQVEGVGQVNVGGGALPAVRVELNPDRLAANGIALDSVRQAITATNVNRPKGVVEEGGRSWQIGANDQARTAADYAPILLSYRDGAAVRLRDVATVVDSVQDVRNYGVANGKPAIVLFVLKSPGANIIETVERVREILPHLRGIDPCSHRRARHQRSHADHSCLPARGRARACHRHRPCGPGRAAVPAQLARDAAARDRRSGFARRHRRRDVPVRLQLRQPLGHGAYRGDRFRGRRCHRRARKHHPAHRAGPHAARGSAEGCARDRLHRDFHLAEPRGGIHSVAADGRRGRAPVPRVRSGSFRRHPGLDGGVADHHADDGRDAAAAPGRTDRPHARAASACARELRPKVLAGAAAGLSTHADLDAAPPAGRGGGAAGRGGAQRLPLRDDSEDVFSAAGHGCPHRAACRPIRAARSR